VSSSVTCYDLQGNPHPVSTTELQWRPSAYGIVVRADKILLVPHDDGYDLPGGRVEFGEMPEQGMLREVYEETGVRADGAQLVHVASTLVKLPSFGEHRFIQSIMMYYTCESAEGEITSSGLDEYEKAHGGLPIWLPLAELPSIKPMSSNDFRPVVLAALQG
jgi:8-oxo-dGTP diphosphatase